MRNEYYPFKKCRDENRYKEIDRIMRQLEKYGRAETHNSVVPRTLAFRYKEAKRQGLIQFAYNKQHKHSLIVLKPGVKLKPVSDQRRKFKFISK